MRQNEIILGDCRQGAQGQLFLVQRVELLEVERFEAWPFPGLTAAETAQSTLARSPEFTAVIAATILSLDHTAPAESQVIAALPDEWKAALRDWVHGRLTDYEAKPYGIQVTFVAHEGAGGFHFTYRKN
ncbi:hypothetical protein [Pandoraea pnomenusa]|uniref:hypothetical protein n=1 Tax=Pandoraea pnomenusa TaxID=93220 RepID=UPI00333FB3EA